MLAEDPIPSQTKFNQALTVMKQLPQSLQPTPEEKLKLYGYYKRSIQDPCPLSRVQITDPMEVAKWRSWCQAEDLSISEAQELYFQEFLKKHSERPNVKDILSSLERGKRISELQLKHHQSLPMKRSGTPPYLISSDDELDHPKLNHFQGFTGINLYSHADPRDLSPFEDQGLGNSSDELEWSDDEASLSTCTVRPYHYRRSRSELTYNSSGLTPEAEKALESLQTQVAALNERLEVLRKELTYTQLKKQESGGWKQAAMSFIKNTAVHFLLIAAMASQAYRSRSFSNRILLFQLLIPFGSIMHYLIASMRKLLR